MISTINILLLSLFVLATSVLLTAALLNRRRVHAVRMIWHEGKDWQKLGWPALFMIFVLAFMLYAGSRGNQFQVYIGLGYLVGGICWCAALYLSTATLVTDYAIFRDMRRADGALCWSQIVDFFIHERRGNSCYIFLYTDDQGRHGRFEVRVPGACQGMFKAMVHRHVASRTLSSPERAYG